MKNNMKRIIPNHDFIDESCDNSMIMIYTTMLFGGLAIVNNVYLHAHRRQDHAYNRTLLPQKQNVSSLFKETSSNKYLHAVPVRELFLYRFVFKSSLF